MSTRIRRSHRDTWALGQLRTMGSWKCATASTRSTKTASGRLVALGLAIAVPLPGDPGFSTLYPKDQTP